jgi:NAD(P)-dependent dehydrogenase (short-subunit alcohol dehydrogenase family)
MSGPSAAFSLAGRTALVTGASSGLGRHCAITLALAGARVVLAARRIDRLKAIEAALLQRGLEAFSVEMDVTVPASVTTAFEALATQRHVPDIVVNNAGIATSAPALSQSVEQWDAVLDTNLKGAWLVACEAARHLQAAGRGGSIVNVASILGLRVGGAVAPYCASKAGLIHLTRALALEWARHGIRVNALAPGYIETDLNQDFLRSEAGLRLQARVPQRRFGQPADLDGPLLLLASDAGAYMTGAVLAIDGGHLVSTL